MIVIGIDPGPLESAYVIWDSEERKIIEYGEASNADMIAALADPARSFNVVPPEHCAIEQVRGFGIMASDALFDTCQWAGRFQERFGDHRTSMVPRKVAAKHICQNSGASADKFIREAIIARYGTEKEAIGKKAAPGPLFGMTGHKWAALAVALTCAETMLQFSEVG